MSFSRDISRFWLAIGLMAAMGLGTESVNAEDTEAQCDVGESAPVNDACVASCKRFPFGDARLAACEGMCRKPVRKVNVNSDCEHVSSCAESCSADAESNSNVVPDPMQGAREISNFRELQQEREKNQAMSVAIRAGNFKSIRRLIEEKGLSPTYIYEYFDSARGKRFEARVVGLRLAEIFADVNVSRDDEESLDKVLALFIELGMDVKATLPVRLNDGEQARVVARRAWSPNIRLMETARDRDARLRTIELALQTGLTPNDDFSEWLFAELPEVCGRDRSKFSIQAFDLLIKYLEPTMAEALWHMSERGPETVADVLDRSFAPPQAKYEFEKAQFAKQDIIWENCTQLSRRINRFLISGK